MWDLGRVACKQALRMGLYISRFRGQKARGRAREGEPAMVLVRFGYCLLIRLTYQIEMNQSQRMRK